MKNDGNPSNGHGTERQDSNAHRFGDKSAARPANSDAARHSDGSATQSDDALDPFDPFDPFEARLSEGFKRLDTLLPESPPGLYQFHNLVQQTKLQEKRRSVRDLVLFLATAILILAGWIISSALDPEVFIQLLLIFSALSLAGGAIAVVQGMRENRGEISQ